MRKMMNAACAICVAGGLSGISVEAVNVETVPVGDPGNAGDDRYPDYYHGVTSFGSVEYEYSIGKYPVTAGQYTEFLNAVASEDSYGLYNPLMWSVSLGCKIQQNGTPGNYTYSVQTGYADRPVNMVSWGDAARFANWLHNGKPIGGQDASTTERGAYTLDGADTNAELQAINRNADWKWAIPSEDEWYKSAYYNSATNSYYDYPTSSDDISTSMANYDESVGHTTDVGAYPFPSPYGTFDQGGNVWEWNEVIHSTSYRGLRGGAYTHDGDIALHASNRSYGSYPADEHVTYVGFRVVQVPEPASLMLMAVAGVAFLRRGGREGH